MSVRSTHIEIKDVDNIYDHARREINQLQERGVGFILVVPEDDWFTKLMTYTTLAPKSTVAVLKDVIASIKITTNN